MAKATKIFLYVGSFHDPGIYFLDKTNAILLAEVKVDQHGRRGGKKYTLNQEFRDQHMKRFSLLLTKAQPYVTTLPVNFNHNMVDKFDWISENCTGVWGLKTARRVIDQSGNYLGIEVDFAFEHMSSAVMFKLMWG